MRVLNPRSGASVLVYAQHDPGSQITLMSSDLFTELGLNAEGESLLTLHTLSDSQTRHFKHASFSVEALHSDQRFSGRKAIVIPPWSHEGYTLPHKQDLSVYPHFYHVETYGLPSRSTVYLLIGLDNSSLRTVVEEREGEPHAIETPLGWIASGGSFCAGTTVCSAHRVCAASNSLDAAKKVRELEETIRLLKLDDEVVQPSINDRQSQSFVDEHLKVINDRYEIPVSFKENISTLPSNYDLAAKRVSSLRKNMLTKPHLRQTVVESMQSLKQRDYVMLAEDSDEKANYLPYFFTTQVKPRVVYNGFEMYKDVASMTPYI